MALRGAWMLYGANGFTGRLIAREAKRKNLPTILAGRRSEPVQTLARELGLPWRSFDLADLPAAAAALNDVDLVLNCAGPFAATSRPLIDACLQTRTHYLDITGEIEVFVAAHARHPLPLGQFVVQAKSLGFVVAYAAPFLEYR